MMGLEEWDGSIFRASLPTLSRVRVDFKSPEAKATRIYFDVPFDKKDKAKPAGLWWNPNRKLWYAPTPEVAAKVRGFKRPA